MNQIETLQSFPDKIYSAAIEVAKHTNQVSRLEMQLRYVEQPWTAQISADTSLKNQGARDSEMERLRASSTRWQYLNKCLEQSRFELAEARAKQSRIDAQYAIAKIAARQRIAELQLRSSLGVTEDLAIDDKVLTTV